MAQVQDPHTEVDEAVRQGFSSDQSVKRDLLDDIKFNMIRAHDGLQRGYHSIMKQIDDDHSGDIYNWLGYVGAWTHVLEHHHTSEEQIFFPFLNTMLDFSEEEAQHKVIHDGIYDINAYITEIVNNKGQGYDPAVLKSKLESIHTFLFEHLRKEVNHLSRDNLSIFDQEKLGAMWRELEEYAKGHGVPFLTLPFMRAHTPPEFKWWPELPWIVSQVLVPYVFAMRHYGYWKYAPFSVS